ncbi:MAG: hypothetical protein J6L91_05365 [Clostridia bacterium]|nr:hypothetical protein [Clostridia bacterium]
MALQVFKIKKTSASSWYVLPTPVTLKPAVNALDNSKSGRDNNTGKMFRDKIAEKLKYTVEVPHGLNNTQVAAILDIILEGSFNAYGPDPKTGRFQTKTFYCSSAEPEINQVYSLTSWDYKSWSFSLTEM